MISTEIHSGARRIASQINSAAASRSRTIATTSNGRIDRQEGGPMRRPPSPPSYTGLLVFVPSGTLRRDHRRRLPDRHLRFLRDSGQPRKDCDHSQTIAPGERWLHAVSAGRTFVRHQLEVDPQQADQREARQDRGGPWCVAISSTAVSSLGGRVPRARRRRVGGQREQRLSVRMPPLRDAAVRRQVRVSAPLRG